MNYSEMEVGEFFNLIFITINNLLEEIKNGWFL